MIDEQTTAAEYATVGYVAQITINVEQEIRRVHIGCDPQPFYADASLAYAIARGKREQATCHAPQASTDSMRAAMRIVEESLRAELTERMEREDDER